MWSLDNQTPFAAERTWVRDKAGRHQWVVAVKGTFVIGRGGRLSIADEQLTPLHEPEYRGEPGRSSLRYESDLIASKPATDIIINAHAHAPKGAAVTQVMVSLRIGALQKTLVVYGDRFYHAGVMGVKPSRPAQFRSKPIIYESAFGGVDITAPDPKEHRMDVRNPIGRGFAVVSSHLRDRAAPDVEYPAKDASEVGPAGFGALASYWSPRLKFAGTYDARWEKGRKPLLPDDYDDRFLLCSPVDQRLPEPLVGGEKLELMNMSSEGVIRFELPRIALRFRTFFGRKVREHAGRLASVIIEPEATRLLLVWHSMLEVGPLDADRLDRTLIEERAAS